MCLAKLAKLAKLANFRIVFLVFVRRLTIVFLLLRRHSSNKFGSALLSFVG